MYAQADLRLCWSHIPHCWKSHVGLKIDAFLSPKLFLSLQTVQTLINVAFCNISTESFLFTKVSVYEGLLKSEPMS